MIIKCLSIIIGVLSVRLFIAYLGQSDYGLWIAISTLSSWAAIGDLGIGNGLKNELSKAYAEKNMVKQQKLISSSFVSLFYFSVIVFFILSILAEILISINVFSPSDRLVFYITNFFTCFNLVLGIFTMIAHVYQMNYICMGFQLLGNLATFMIIYCFYRLRFNIPLIVFALVFELFIVMPNVFIYILLKKKVGICQKHFDWKEARNNRRILSLGVKFFILQLCGIVLYSTDNVIIKALFGNENVTKYDVITKIYNSFDSIFSIVLVNLWTAVSYKSSLNDYRWIKDKIRKVLFIWCIYSLFVILFSIVINNVMKIWLGENAVKYDALTIIIFSLFAIWGAFGSIFVNVSNGLSLLKVQLIICIVETVLNIPLSILLASGCGMGIVGVKLATLICCLGANVIMPLYVTNYLGKRC